MSAFASVGRKEQRKLLTGNSSVENAGRTSHSPSRLRSQKEEGVEGEAGFLAAPMGRGEEKSPTHSSRPTCADDSKPQKPEEEGGLPKCEDGTTPV